MQNWGFSRAVLRLMAIVGVLVGALTVAGCSGGGGSNGGQPVVATSNTTVPINHATIQPLEGKTFQIPPSARLGNQQPITVTFTNTTAATPTTTVTTQDGQSFTAATTFGSCILTVTSSTIPDLPPGQVITINPCQYILQTSGVTTNNPTVVGLVLQLDEVTSTNTVQVTVLVESNGELVVNGIDTGVQVALGPATGGGGGT